MIFKLRAFIEKSSQADSNFAATQVFSKDAQTKLNEEAEKRKLESEGAQRMRQKSVPPAKARSQAIPVIQPVHPAKMIRD